jgi:hypothetical protein
MQRLWLIALSLLSLSGCVQGSDNALLPDLKGRWVAEKGARIRLAMMSDNPNVAVASPTLKELCQSEYVTFEKSRSGSDAGAVMLHRQGRREVAFLIVDAKQEGTRIRLTGREQGPPLAGRGPVRIELALRKGEIVFDDIVEERGRSVRYDHFKTPDAVRAQRAGLVTIGDMFRLLFDLKSCA